MSESVQTLMRMATAVGVPEPQAEEFARFVLTHDGEIDLRVLAREFKQGHVAPTTEQETALRGQRRVLALETLAKQQAEKLKKSELMIKELTDLALKQKAKLLAREIDTAAILMAASVGRMLEFHAGPVQQQGSKDALARLQGTKDNLARLADAALIGAEILMQRWTERRTTREPADEG